MKRNPSVPMQLPAPPGVDALRDDYVARLEAALREIATAGKLGSSIARELDRCILAAREALGTGEIPRIPDNISLKPHEVRFTRWPNDEWHLIGPADFLIEGTMVEVRRFTEHDLSLVAVGQTVAERTVIHRGPGPTRYVVARVSKAVRD